MLEPILHITAIKVLEEYKTKGSAPLKIVGSDDNLYVTKFTDQKHPYLELINEVICGYLTKCWNFTSPKFAVVTIPENVKQRFAFSSRYKEDYFKNDFFGSQIIEPSSDLDKYIKGVNKNTYREFENGLDLLRIGCFDHWIGNRDRRPENANVLISRNPLSGKFRFVPIDHTAAFGYFDYKEINDAKLQLNKSILECDFIKSICNFEDAERIERLHKEVKRNISYSLKELDYIFKQVPREWVLVRNPEIG